MLLIDTDTMAFFFRGHPQVVDNFREHRQDPKAISVITVGELLFGARKSKRPVENEAKVLQAVESFEVIPVSVQVMEIYASVRTAVERVGKPVPGFDLLIASTALHRDLELVTNNERHFVHVPGLRVANWSK